MLGKVESGKLDKGEALMLMPNKVTTWLTSGACSQLRYREMRFFSVNLDQYYTSGPIPFGTALFVPKAKRLRLFEIQYGCGKFLVCCFLW